MIPLGKAYYIDFTTVPNIVKKKLPKYFTREYDIQTRLSAVGDGACQVR
jgi:hypothetical protein